MQDKTDLLHWLHQHIPFAAMLATEEIGQRPLLTRAIENGIVAVVSGAFAAYVTLHTLQAVHNTQIEDLQRMIAVEHQDSLQQFQILRAQVMAATTVSAVQSVTW